MKEKTSITLSADILTAIDRLAGSLRHEAVFPEGKVEINQFRKLKKAAGAD